jgi:hypothetical protein
VSRSSVKVLLLVVVVSLCTASLSFGAIVYTYNGNPLDNEHASWALLLPFIGYAINIDFTLPDGKVLADYLNADLVASGVAVQISDAVNTFAAASAVISGLDAWNNPLYWNISAQSSQAGGNFVMVWDLTSVSSAAGAQDMTHIREFYWGGADEAWRLNTNSPGVWSHIPPTAVPEPATFILVSAGLGGISLVRRKSRNQ